MCQDQEIASEKLIACIVQDKLPKIYYTWMLHNGTD